jgi:hypothetical protein
LFFVLRFVVLYASYLDLHLEIKDATDTARDASYLDLHLEIKDITDTARDASYLDLHLEIKDATDTARICVCLRIVVANTYCVVVFCFAFRRLVYPMLPIGWIVPFLMPIRCSLMFIFHRRLS